jgi:hypothetical protein
MRWTGGSGRPRHPIGNCQVTRPGRTASGVRSPAGPRSSCRRIPAVTSKLPSLSRFWTTGSRAPLLLLTIPGVCAVWTVTTELDDQQQLGRLEHRRSLRQADAEQFGQVRRTRPRATLRGNAVVPLSSCRATSGPSDPSPPTRGNRASRERLLSRSGRPRSGRLLRRHRHRPDRVRSEPRRTIGSAPRAGARVHASGRSFSRADLCFHPCSERAARL